MTKQRKPEVTSARVARIAGRVLRLGAKMCYGNSQTPIRPLTPIYFYEYGRLDKICTWSELKSVMASALTQAEDKPKRAKRRMPVHNALNIAPKPRLRARRK